MAIQTNQLSEKDNQLTDMSVAVVPAAPGLHIVQVPSNLPSIYIRRALEQAVVASGSAYSLGFEKPHQLISFLSISKNQQAQANALYGNNYASDGGEQPSLVLLGKNQFDVFSPEGLLYVSLKTGKTRSATVCTLQQQARSTFQPSQVESFIKLQSHAHEKNICFIVFLQSDLSPDAIGCTELADDYLQLNYCEPYLGAVTSFSVNSLNRQWLNGFAVGNVQMSTIWESGCRLSLTTESFVHEQLDSRLAWLAKELKVPGDVLKAAIGKSRSTIWRDLKKIYVPSPIQMPDPNLVHDQLALLERGRSDIEPGDD